MQPQENTEKPLEGVKSCHFQKLKLLNTSTLDDFALTQLLVVHY